MEEPLMTERALERASSSVEEEPSVSPEDLKVHVPSVESSRILENGETYRENDIETKSFYGGNKDAVEYAWRKATRIGNGDDERFMASQNAIFPLEAMKDHKGDNPQLQTMLNFLTARGDGETIGRAAESISRTGFKLIKPIKLQDDKWELCKCASYLLSLI